MAGAFPDQGHDQYGVRMVSSEPLTGFAIAAVLEDGRWRCSVLEDGLEELDAAIDELRKLRSTGAVFGMLAVDDEFFILLRPSPQGVATVLSDAAAALDYDIAADVLDLLRAEPPEDEDDEIWPAGDLALLADLGLPEAEMQVIVDEVDLYPDEQLRMVAQRCGFADEFDNALERISS